MKRRKLKTVIASSLAALLILPAALYAEESESSESASTEQAESEESGSDTEVSSESTDAEDSAGTKDIGELKTLHVLAPEGSTGKFKLSERHRYHIWDEFEKLAASFGIKFDIETVSDEQYKNTIQTRLATGTDLPDFANTNTVGDATLLDMAKSGQIKNIANLPELGDGTAKKFFGEGGIGYQSWKLNTFKDGSVYWISQIQKSKAEKSGTQLNAQIRTDWLKKVGMEMPQTIDELEAALKAFQENDVNGNGSKDEVVTIDFSIFANGVSNWFGLGNSLSSLRIQDGKADIVSPWHQEGIKDYFRFLNKLYEEGLIDPQVIGSTEENKNVENNKASMIYSYTMAVWSEASVAGVKDANYLAIDPLKGTENDPILITVEPGTMSWGRWSFTSHATDDDANARLLDMLSSDRYAELTYLGIEGETYVMEGDLPRILPIALHDAYDEAYDKGIVMGDYLWANGGCFPKRRYPPFVSDDATLKPDKYAYQDKYQTWPDYVPTDKNIYLPVPEEEEMEEIRMLSTDLDTRSKEIAASLILGEEDIENIDMLVEELDELGLKKLVEIDNKRLERAKKMGIIS